MTKESRVLDIFMKFLPREFLLSVWNFYPKETWAYGSVRNPSTINGGKCSYKLLYTMLAVYVRICALQDTPKENDPHKRPMRDAVVEAMNLFKERAPEHKFPGLTVIETLISRFHIPRQLYKELGLQFQSVISHCGRVLAGDEKLLHFTGDSAFIRQIITKPDKIGFWFYEIVCMLGDRTPFLLQTRVQDNCVNLGEHIACDEILEEWGSIAKSYKIKNNNCGPVVVFDSYYTVNAGRKWLNDNGVLFIGSVNKQRFLPLMAAMKQYGDPVTKPGQTAGLYNSAKKEIFVHHWDTNEAVNRKYVLSNAFVPAPNTRHTSHTTPAYDFYKEFFSGCDIFNRNLHDRKYCFRSGGRDHGGASGHIHKFYMAALLQNTFALFKTLHPRSAEEMSFMQLGVMLSNQLMDYVVNMDVV